jgi:hypothetical protein
MTTALDLISSSLRSIGALASGETPTAEQTDDAFNMLNDMLAMWSNERMLLHYETEVIFPVVLNTYQYTIGPGGTIGAVFSGTQSLGVVTVSSVTSGAIAIGQTLSTGGTILSFGTGAGGSGTNAVGTYNVSSSQTVTTQSITASYQRPLRINSGFTRISTIDYQLEARNVEDYKLIGLKALPGPWAKIAYYQPSMPLGNITLWPNPTSAGDVHLYCDTILQSFGATSDTVRLPQGYNLGISRSLAELLLPDYGRVDQTIVTMISSQAARFRGLLKRTNMHPQAQAQIDPLLIGQRIDAGWIMDGGFNR